MPDVSFSGLLIVAVVSFLCPLLLGLAPRAALLYRPLIGSRPAAIAALLQATSLPFIVAASQIGMQLGAITRVTGAGLVAAGLLSVLIFPAVALTLLARVDPPVSANHAADRPIAKEAT